MFFFKYSLLTAEQCEEDVSNNVLLYCTVRFTMKINISLNDCDWVKSYIPKRLQLFYLQKMSDRYIPWSKIGAWSLTSVIFAVVRAVCHRPQPGHKSVMPLLSFSSMFLIGQTLFSVRKHLRKAICFILYIHWRAFN